MQSVFAAKKNWTELSYRMHSKLFKSPMCKLIDTFKETQINEKEETQQCDTTSNFNPISGRHWQEVTRKIQENRIHDAHRPI